MPGSQTTYAHTLQTHLYRTSVRNARYNRSARARCSFGGVAPECGVTTLFVGPDPWVGSAVRNSWSTMASNMHGDVILSYRRLRLAPGSHFNFSRLGDDQHHGADPDPTGPQQGARNSTQGIRERADLAV